MGNIFSYLADILYIVLAVTTVVVFTKRGFVDSAYRYGRTVFAAIITYFVGPHVSALLYEKFIYRGIYNWVFDKVDVFLQETVGTVDVQGLIDSLPFLVRQLVDREAMEAKYGSAESLELVAQDVSDFVAHPFASLLSNLIAYVAVFFLAKLVLMVVFKVLDFVFKMPILNAVNKLLGFAFGLISAGILLAIITYVLGILVGIFGSTGFLNELTASSRIYGFFHNLSIFDLFHVINKVIE